MYIYICVCVCIYIYVYADTHTHTPKCKHLKIYEMVYYKLTTYMLFECCCTLGNLLWFPSQVRRPLGFTRGHLSSKRVGEKWHNWYSTVLFLYKPHDGTLFYPPYERGPASCCYVSFRIGESTPTTTTRPTPCLPVPVPFFFLPCSGKNTPGMRGTRAPSP